MSDETVGNIEQLWTTDTPTSYEIGPIELEGMSDLREENRQLRELLGECKTAFESLPEDALGIAGNGKTKWYIRDELVSKIQNHLEGSEG